MEKGDIKLDGKSYRIDLATYRARDIVDFAPRSATPGGSIIMSDLSLWQPLYMTDWRHGFGHQWYDDALAYLRTDGNVDTRHGGIAMLYTDSTSSDTDNDKKIGFTNFNGKWYSWGDGGLRVYNGTAWSDVAGGTAVRCALNNGDYLYYAPEGSRLQKMDTSDVVTDAGLNADSKDYHWMIRHNGFVFAGKYDTNQVYRGNSLTLADLQGTTADENIIYIGRGDIPTIWAKVFDGNLYIGRQDGIWHLGEDGVARLLVDHSREQDSTNLLSGEVVNGFLMFPVRDQIVQWNGVRVSDTTPGAVSDSFPYKTYGKFKNFVVTDNYLYCTAQTTDSTYEIHLLCFDGVAWHKLSELVTNGTDDITAMAYDVVNNRLWYHVDATADVTYYIQFNTSSPYPFEGFPTTGTHSLISSRMDMGFRRIKKSMDTIWIEGSGLSTTTYLKVYFTLDGSSTWQHWGNVTSDGVTKLTAPGGKNTQEFNHALLRIDFVTDTASLSPILEGMTIRFMLRPDVVFGYNFDVFAGNVVSYGHHADMRSSKTIVKQLREMRDSKSPIKFVNLLGEEERVYISTVTETADSRSANKAEGIDDVQYRININLVGV
jgi:hypothetical protein